MQYRIKVVTYSDGVKEFIPQYRSVWATAWLWTKYREIAGYDHSVTVSFFSESLCREFLNKEIASQKAKIAISVTYKSHP